MVSGWPKPKRRRAGAPRVMKQMTFAERPTKAGRARKKPGPKPAARPNVRHRVRPEHATRIPLHITMRAIAGLPSFRHESLYRAFEKAFRTTRRPDFHIVEYSVQDNHLHLIVEADSRDALGRGMKSFSVRANRLFNSALGRGRGRVWGDRYHRRDLKSPRQVRHALIYCLNNYKKHHGISRGKRRIDFFSSARWFQGWDAARSARDGERPTEAPTQFLLTTLWWKKHGLIDPAESPTVQDEGRGSALRDDRVVAQQGHAATRTLTLAELIASSQGHAPQTLIGAAELGDNRASRAHRERERFDFWRTARAG